MEVQKSLLNSMVVGAALLMSGSVFASGFALIEQSGSGLGNAFAGGAAIAEDASTLFFNPAGITRLSGNQLAFAGHAIKPSMKFTNTGSTSVPAGGNGGDAGDWAFVPNMYATMQVSPDLFLGLSVNAPFGLKTEYEPTWMGRYQALKSEVQVVSFSPTVAVKISDSFSFGLGLSYNKAKGELSQAALVGTANLEGDDSAVGYNVGALITPSTQTRIGFDYRSSVKYRLEGKLTSLAGAMPVSLALDTPGTFSASVFHQLNAKWDVMADMSRTDWSVFERLQVVNNSGVPVSTTPENWRDTWRVAFGANHHYSDQWTARVGVAFDQTPVRDEFRTARLPDSSRTWLALGGQYKPAKNSAIDFGYAHLFTRDTPIADKRGAAGGGNLIGNYDNKIDILSAQYTYSF